MVPIEIQPNEAIRQKPSEKLPFWLNFYRDRCVWRSASTFKILYSFGHENFINTNLTYVMPLFWQFWVNFRGEYPRIYLYMRAFYVYLPILYYFSALDLVWAFIDFEIESSAIDAIYFNFFINHPSVLFTQSGHPKFAHHDSDC